MKRLFETIARGGHHAIVRGKNEHGEYVVTLYKTYSAVTYGGRVQHDSEKVSDYFTDDFDDACATALCMH